MRVGRGECLSEGGTGMSGEGRSKLIIDLESFLNFVFNLLLCFFSFLMMMSEEVSEPAEQGSVSVLGTQGADLWGPLLFPAKGLCKQGRCPMGLSSSGRPV